MYSKEQLLDNQNCAKLALEKSQALETKFADRFNMAESLFAVLDKEKFIEYNDIDPNDPCRVETWQDDNIPDKSYSLNHIGPVFGFDIDTMIGPESWWNEDCGVDDYVLRRKCYIYDWTSEKLKENFPELKYFTDLHKEFVPVLQHYYNECFQDQHVDIAKTLHKLMIIEYSNPTANAGNIMEHKKHNTDRFGPTHCDETLGGLHLGENVVEFYVEDHITKECKHVTELSENNILWFFGEFSERSGWQPSMHGMKHNPSDDTWKRYSIVFDLQARYKGEE
jgi:hypothetical protein